MPKSRGRKKQPDRTRKQSRPTLSPAGSVARVRHQGRSVDLAAEVGPGVTARVVRAEETERFSELISLTGAGVDDHLAVILQSHELAVAVLAGAEHSAERFRLELARCLASAADPELAAIAATLPLVAVSADEEIVGALLAYPPTNVIEQYLNAQPKASKQEGFRTLLSGIMGVAKLRALAVDPAWQGQGIGSGLLTRFKEIYLACNYFDLYGQFRADTSLAAFYGAHGFDILSADEPLDLQVVFGIGGGVFPESGEQIFHYHRPG